MNTEISMVSAMDTLNIKKHGEFNAMWIIKWLEIEPLILKKFGDVKSLNYKLWDDFPEFADFLQWEGEGIRGEVFKLTLQEILKEKIDWLKGWSYFSEQQKERATQAIKNALSLL